MCDYSLETYGSRPAAIGERYVVTRFPSSAKGFADVGKSVIPVPVCVQCDMKLRLTGLTLQFQKDHNVGEEADVVFAQDEKTAGQRFAYRDGVILPTGEFVLMQSLPEGVGAYLIDDLAEGVRPKAFAEAV